MAPGPQTTTRPTMENKNVAGGPLHLFSKDPPTGYFRDGYCRTSAEDPGNHSVAATVSQSFLDFSAAQGNNLKDAGVKPGMKWCLCASRWKEAMQAAIDGKVAEDAVPRVHLHATHEAALKAVSYKDLKKYAAEAEAVSQQGRQESHHDPNSNRSIAREHHEIGGHDLPLAPGAGRWQGNKTEVTGTSAPRG